MGAELFHADGKTDGRRGMMKLIFAFRNFANAPKNESCFVVSLATVSVTQIYRLYQKEHAKLREKLL